jgi:hypothetical protein
MSTHVPFITAEEGDDLIVSFGLGQYASESLTLLRTPKFESLLADEERGVTVGTGASNGDSELLVSVHWHKLSVQITSTARTYELDLRAVDASELNDAKAILRKMNFDKRFEIQGT